MTYTGDSLIATKGRASAAGIQAWFEENAAAGAAYVGLPEVEIPAGTGGWVVEFSEAWNVNADMLAALCGHESAWFQSKICRDKNNPGGYGAENDDPYNKAITFPTLREGIRAVAAHLAGYVHGTGAWNAYSPRHPILVSKGWDGSVKKLTDLNGKWAWPGKTYGQSLARIANDLLSRIEEEAPPMSSGLPVRVSHIPRDNKNRPGLPMTPVYITVHETANTRRGANAEMHRQFTHNGGGSEGVSFHDVIDDKEIVELLPDNENGWHAGDGYNGVGNRQSIGIEICVNSDGDFSKALALAARRVDQRMRKLDIPIENVVQHNRWSGKGCPANLRKAGLWNHFIDSVKALNGKGSPGQPPSVPPARDLPTVPDPWGSTYWIPRLFVDEIKRHDWMTVGHCKSGAFLEGRKIVQYFERARLELNEDGTVTRGLVGAEVYGHRYPNGAP